MQEARDSNEPAPSYVEVTCQRCGKTLTELGVSLDGAIAHYESCDAEPAPSCPLAALFGAVPDMPLEEPAPGLAEQAISSDKLSHLTECVHSWEPQVCLLGNVTALDLRGFCAELTRLRAAEPAPSLVELQSARDLSALQAKVARAAALLEDARPHALPNSTSSYAFDRALEALR